MCRVKGLRVYWVCSGTKGLVVVMVVEVGGRKSGDNKKFVGKIKSGEKIGEAGGQSE